MIGDGKTYIWIPSQLTVWLLTDETAAIVNAIHMALGRQLVNAGDPNPYYFYMNDLDMGGAPFTRDKLPGMAVCGPIDNLAYISIDQIQLIISCGGEIEGLPLWFEIDDIEANVPANLLAISNTGPTWETWGTFGESHKPRKIGDKWYRSTAIGQSGDLLLASIAIASGVTLLTKAQYLELLPSNP